MPTPDSTDLLKTKLVHYLDGLESAIRSGGDLVITQAPEIVREMVAYRLVASGGLCVVAIVVLVATAVYIWRVWRWNVSGAAEESDFDAVLVNMSSGMVCAAIIIGFTAIFTTNADTFLKCWLAPKYFVLQEVAEMLKK